MGGYGFDADLSLTWLGQLLGDKKMAVASTVEERCKDVPHNGLSEARACWAHIVLVLPAAGCVSRLVLLVHEPINHFTPLLHLCIIYTFSLLERQHRQPWFDYSQSSFSFSPTSYPPTSKVSPSVHTWTMSAMTASANACSTLSSQTWAEAWAATTPMRTTATALPQLRRLPRLITSCPSVPPPGAPRAIALEI